MEINMYVDRYKNVRLNLYKWRYELSFFYKIVLALGLACLTGLLAQIRFYIPGTPVPVTGQVFGVILAGVLLGTWGGISQMLYLGIGAFGVPWFAGFGGGLAYLVTTPTLGYLIGFVIASFFIGFVVDRYLKSRKFLSMTLLILFATFFLVYIPGLIYFYFWFGSNLSFIELLTMCVLPFIAADVVKAVVGAGMATTIIPKTSYSREVDI